MENAPFQKVAPTFFYGYVVIAAAWVILIAAFGVHYAFGIFLKPMLAEFGWGRGITSGAYSLSWLIQGLSAVLMGRMNDRYGPRFVLTLCGTLMGSGFLLTTQVSTGWHLYLSYGVLIGIATGGFYVPTASTIAKWFIARRNMMTGMAVSGIGLGTFLVSPVANYLVSAYDWRTSYMILGISVFLVIVLAAQFLRRDPAQIGQRPYGHGETVVRPSQRKDLGHSLKEAFRMREFWYLFGMFFCFGFAVLSIIVHIAPHTTDLGKSPATAANFVASIGIASIFGKILLGILGDRLGNRTVFILCFSLMAASLCWLVSVRETAFFFLFTILFGLAYGGNATSQSPLVAEIFGLRSHGLIFGTVNNGFTIGATLGPVATGVLFDLTGAYRTAFFVIAALAFVGLIISLSLGRPRAGD